MQAHDHPMRDLNRRDVIAALTASFAGALASKSPAQSSAAASCVLTPVTGEGPFYFDPKLVRSDITERQPGVPLVLDIRVVTAGDCKPIPEARVDVWHADARGVYSGYGDQRGSGASPDRSARGKTFLRGTQFANSDGLATFKTIYPSWYRGRTPHIHFKIILDSREAAVSQLYFRDDLSDRIFRTSNAYVARQRNRDTYNENDMFMRAGQIGGAFCDVTQESSGTAGAVYRAFALIAIDRSS
jgi:protocatechuate 3,4-dioxygenase beta subunit